MLVSHFFDLVPIWMLLVGTIFLMVLFIELGFRLGRKAQASAKKAQTSQVRAIMGAGLGLLAFMLAFTFSIESMDWCRIAMVGPYGFILC